MSVPLPKTHQEKIANAKVLVVGAGGIGCELLKNLALSGFKNIETIDLDTIDVSNLNRQFLFQKIHVGKPKALVASQAVQNLAGPSLKISPHHCSIFEPEYNKSYFQQFDIVLNALDNLSARRHVNRICMSANLPLIESGSAGYLGQSYPIIKSTTECFDCRPKPKRKTYPACTIRNRPTEPVHCIVWAKFLYSQLFGEYDADNEVSPEAQLLDDEEKTSMEDKEDKEVTATKSLEAAKVSTRDFAEKCDYCAQKLFNKFYHEDVKTLLSMDTLWTKRTPPTPQNWELPETEAEKSLKSRDIPNLKQLCHLFQDSLSKIKDQYNNGSQEPLSWDKDDANALNFVVAAANLRALVFNINLKSQWDVKSIAGNIIPAIASTNAMVAGLIVLQAIAKLTRDDFNKKQGYKNALVQNIGNKRIMANMTDVPTEGCFSCMDKATMTICVDFEKTSLKEFKEGLIGQEMSLQQPDVRVGESCVLRVFLENETDFRFYDSIP